MIKYFFKQYWRYIAMALAFASITFLTNACEVNAQESQIQSITFGNWIGVSANDGPTFTIYQKSVSNAPLKNFGRAFLQFNVILYNASSNTDTLVPSLREINVQSTGNTYTCNLGSVSQSYSGGTTYKANLYSVLCDVNLGENGLQKVELEISNTQSFPFQILTSDYLTAIDNIDDNLSGQIDSINANMGTYIGNLISSQNFGNDELTNIKTIVNTNLTTIISKLEGINIRLDSINTNLFTYINNVIGAINNGNDAISQQTQQQHSDAVSQKQSTDAINNSINDSDTSSVSLDTLTGQTIDTGVISGLMLIPINLVNSMIVAFNGTCHAYEIGDLLGTTLVLPCINLESFLGTPLWNTIDIMITGVFIFGMAKLFMRLFNKLMRLQDIWFGGVDFCD